MNVKFEEGEVLVLLNESDRDVIGIASSLDGFSNLIEDLITDPNASLIKWSYTTENDCVFNIHLLISFDNGNEREELFIAQKYSIYS